MVITLHRNTGLRYRYFCGPNWHPTE